MSITEIKEATKVLSDLDCSALAAWLLDSLPPHSDENGIPDSIEEADRRRGELDTNLVQSLSAEEFWQGVNRERARWSL